MMTQHFREVFSEKTKKSLFCRLPFSKKRQCYMDDDTKDMDNGEQKC
jgi:hypothetical protein